MSHDFAFWMSGDPLEDEDARQIYVQLAEKGAHPQVSPSASVAAMYRDVVSLSPELSDENVDDSPWASKLDVAPTHLIVAIVPSRLWDVWRVAAAAIYAAADPFGNALDQQPSCQLATYPSTTLPLYVLHRSCDALMACDTMQQTAFKNPPGININEWLRTLKGRMGDETVTDQIIDANRKASAACAGLAQCSFKTGFDNHTRWPDGIDDGSGHDWEPAMLEFLRAHPLP